MRQSLEQVGLVDQAVQRETLWPIQPGSASISSAYLAFELLKTSPGQFFPRAASNHTSQRALPRKRERELRRPPIFICNRPALAGEGWGGGTLGKRTSARGPPLCFRRGARMAIIRRLRSVGGKRGPGHRSTPLPPTQSFRDDGRRPEQTTGRSQFLPHALDSLLHVREGKWLERVFINLAQDHRCAALR
jgi:hypothetical protein